jgi:hypothetical protein
LIAKIVSQTLNWIIFFRNCIESEEKIMFHCLDLVETRMKFFITIFFIESFNSIFNSQ